MKRVGVLTHYYDTVNYGGALQAYALCKAIKVLGFECEQIDVNWHIYQNINNDSVMNKSNACFDKTVFTRFIYAKVRWFYYRILRFSYNHKRKVLRKKYRKSFYAFKNLIPHTEKEYTKKNICETISDYDAFIVGSDQVWNPIWYFEPFFLTFVPPNISKVSYAASISQSYLSENVKKIYQENLKDFKAISVREKSAIDLLSDISPVEVEQVLDPTLLLSKDEWDKIASDSFIDKPYIFCYFLGDDKNMREVAAEYAKSQNKTLVNIMHAAALYHKNDLKFADIKLKAPSPEEFLSLIKNAEVVLTDSFHASVFSWIFEKQFFVFQRQGYSGMNTRIDDLMEMLKTPYRFCNTNDKMSVYYMNGVPRVDYSMANDDYEYKKNQSLEFLEKNLNGENVLNEG